MKRSEMVDILATHLEEQFGVDQAGYEAGLLLLVLESEGMIPRNIDMGDSGRGDITELLDYSELDYEIGWESEDE